ncbi:MAG: SufD family Fe-S cluster assembly protein [Lachnospiraceae bacterium]
MNAQKIDINLSVNHLGKKTESEIKANGALMDSAEKVFRGTIDFKNGSIRFSRRGKRKPYSCSATT